MIERHTDPVVVRSSCKDINVVGVRHPDLSHMESVESLAAKYLGGRWGESLIKQETAHAIGDLSRFAVRHAPYPSRTIWGEITPDLGSSNLVDFNPLIIDCRSRELQRLLQILGFEVGIVGKHGNPVRVVRQKFENPSHGDSHATDARLPPAFARFHCDPIERADGRHSFSLEQPETQTPPRTSSSQRRCVLHARRAVLTVHVQET